MKIAQPRLDRTLRAVELRIGPNRYQRGVVASVVTGDGGVHAVFRKQLVRRPNVGGRKPQAVTAARAQNDRSPNLVADAAEQPIRGSEIAVLDQAANARA